MIHEPGSTIDDRSGAIRHHNTPIVIRRYKRKKLTSDDLSQYWTGSSCGMGEALLGSKRDPQHSLYFAGVVSRAIEDRLPPRVRVSRIEQEQLMNSVEFRACIGVEVP